MFSFEMMLSWYYNGVWQKKKILFMVKIVLREGFNRAEFFCILFNFGGRLFVSQIGLKLKSTQMRISLHHNKNRPCKPQSKIITVVSYQIKTFYSSKFVWNQRVSYKNTVIYAKLSFFILKNANFPQTSDKVSNGHSICSETFVLHIPGFAKVLLHF